MAVNDCSVTVVVGLITGSSIAVESWIESKVDINTFLESSVAFDCSIWSSIAVVDGIDT